MFTLFFFIVPSYSKNIFNIKYISFFPGLQLNYQIFYAMGKRKSAAKRKKIWKKYRMRGKKVKQHCLISLPFQPTKEVMTDPCKIQQTKECLNSVKSSDVFCHEMSDFIKGNGKLSSKPIEANSCSHKIADETIPDVFFENCPRNTDTNELWEGIQHDFSEKVQSWLETISNKKEQHSAAVICHEKSHQSVDLFADNSPFASQCSSPLTTTSAHSPLTTTPAHSPLTTTAEHSPLTTTAEHSPLTTTSAHSPLTTTSAHSPLTTTSAHSPLTTTSAHSPLTTTSAHSPLTTTPAQSSSPTTTSAQNSSLTVSSLASSLTVKKVQFSPHVTRVEYLEESTKPSEIVLFIGETNVQLLNERKHSLCVNNAKPTGLELKMMNSICTNYDEANAHISVRKFKAFYKYCKSNGRKDVWNHFLCSDAGKISYAVICSSLKKKLVGKKT